VVSTQSTTRYTGEIFFFFFFFLIEKSQFMGLINQDNRSKSG
jgi:hypothetical protein